MNVYVGIDVACAKRKALPICFVAYVGGKLKTLSPPIEFLQKVPRGLGNKEVTNDLPFRLAAEQTVKAFQYLSDHLGWNIDRIAIDAPAAPPREGKRKSELALNEAGLQCILTPDNEAWKNRIKSSREYLDNGGAISRLPGANQIWMLYGFELFRAFQNAGIREVIEVYPYAIIRALLPTCGHKTTPEGYHLQLGAIARATGSMPTMLEDELKRSIRGSRDDRLDAYMAAWVASLRPESRHSFGPENDSSDSIWVPIL